MNSFKKINDYSFIRLCTALILGIITSVIVVRFGFGRISLLVGWDVTALVFVIWTLLIISPMTATRTARFALREDPGRVGTSTFLTLASFASLAAIGSALVEAHSDAHNVFILTAISVASVIFSWLLIHVVFTLHYARLFYADHIEGTIDFGSDKHPTYIDFMYVAFTVGMTFQISDTAVSGTEIRKTVIRHAILSYVFGTVIVATTVSIIAGL